MRLIDADEVIEKVKLLIQVDKEAGCIGTRLFTLKNVIDFLNESETIAPVKHGHWEESKCLDDCFWVCSCCKFPSQASAAHKLYKYCPNCGARMDEKEDLNNDD